jgi:acetyltransferase-like isoleucine patch superfamily enzyme
MSPISDLILGEIRGLYTDSFIANFGNNVTWRYWNSCRFNNAEIHFGDDCYLSRLPYVYISGNITFGNNCKVDNAFRLNAYYYNIPYKGSINMTFGDNCNVNFIHNQWNTTNENRWDFNITFGNDCYISRVIPRNYLSWNYCYLNIGNNCICNNLTDAWGSLNAVTIRLGYNCNFTNMGLNDYDNTILELPTGGYNANDFPYSVRRNIRWY